MRKAMLLLAALGLAGTLWAADPIIGTWKLNVSKTNPPPPIKSAIEVYRLIEGDQIELTYTGSNGEETFTFPRQGGAFKYVKSTFNIKDKSGVEMLINPNEWYAMSMRNGEQIELAHKTISQDGKTMVQVWKVKDPMGMEHNFTRVFDKQ